MTTPFWFYFDEADDSYLVMTIEEGDQDIARAWDKATAERIVDALDTVARAEATDNVMRHLVECESCDWWFVGKTRAFHFCSDFLFGVEAYRRASEGQVTG